LCDHLHQCPSPDITSGVQIAGRCELESTARPPARRQRPDPLPIHEIAERWIWEFERDRLQAMSDLRKTLETKS
jgi:hypothetical protein